MSEATAATVEKRAITTFYDNVAKGAAAAAKLAPKTCEQLGTFENPVKLHGDKIAAIVKWLITAITTFGAGKIVPGVEVNNPAVPDPVSDQIYKVSIEQNVKAGEWFYFSSPPEWLFQWSGSYISVVYDRENKRYINYDRNGNIQPVF
jgi:hypothetical protein